MNLQPRSSRGRKKIRVNVSMGITAMNSSTVWIENISANIPVTGVISPPSPYASPVIRLVAIVLPAGANFWTSATPSGRVASMKKPVRNAPAYAQLPGRKSSKKILGVVRRCDTQKTRLKPMRSERWPATSPLTEPAAVNNDTMVPMDINEYP